ncbi:MAG: ectoine synthase [Proteobacteria bacterium]|nr:ectoine synthase [Pseudomonadota bacterium]
MIVRSLQDIVGTDRDVRGPGWKSRRIILKRDGVGCSVHDTVVTEGTEMRMQYKHHFETNYCIEGEGEVEEIATGKIHKLSPGTVYALDKHDAHIVRALKGDLRVVCVFYPALSGNETHDADGSYLPSED